jgi:signal transduction histidine kinase/ligand-binding sensor domain-containing protein
MAALVFMLAVPLPVFALNPALQVSQYAHTAWRIGDGVFQGTIRAIGQTTDGYLWFGTEFGLLRFDGTRPVEWKPPAGQALPSTDIWSVLAAHDGALWIGTSKGLARWKAGKLTQYPQLAGRIVQSLLEDREHTIWASGAAVPAGLLCAIREDLNRCFGESGTFGIGVFGLYEDRKGNLWAGDSDRLWKWRPEPSTWIPMPGESVQGFAECRDGTLLIGTRNGIQSLRDGFEKAVPITGPGWSLPSRLLLRDRDGALWSAYNEGIVHIYNGRSDRYAQADGLSGDAVWRFFEDREGNIWVATWRGLDRFHDVAVSTFSDREGLPHSVANSLAQSRDGSVLIGTPGGVARWANGTLILERPGVGVSGPLLEDARGRLWLYNRTQGFGSVENGRFVVAKNIHTSSPRATAQDSRGNLWLADQSEGLLRLSPDGEVERMPWASLGHTAFATDMIADGVDGGLWLGFWDGGIAYFKDGSIRRAYPPGHGVVAGRVSSLASDSDGTLWISTENGLTRLSHGKASTLSTRNGLPCDAVHSVVEDDAGSLWLNMRCGLIRIARADVDAWAMNQRQSVTGTVFDASDGTRIQGEFPIGYNRTVAKSADGRLWFVVPGGVSVVDPRHLPFNSLPPPVHIEQIIADRKSYDATSITNAQMRLPPLIRDLQIDYTALSLVAPEKNRFRIKLEGWDRDWQEIGNRRQAFYSNLPPRNYRFRVIASNNSGVWNEAGTFLDFSVAPAYYQTTWFRGTLVAGFLVLLGALYQLRLRQVARQFNRSLEARVSERMRIARDLHDTLLQSFQGVLLNFHAVTFLLPERPGDAKTTLKAAIEQASQAITEGRDAVQGLRSSTVVTSDLARALGALGEELGDRSDPHAPDFRVHVEGTPRDLAPILGDEVYRIAGEALRNAFRHARAAQIEVEIHYDRKQFRLRVRDDGKGIEPGVLDGRARDGHFGLAGMHERAKLVGGSLAVWSECDSGTEAELTIPAAIAYARTE